jgi:serine/threonine protein kinase
MAVVVACKSCGKRLSIPESLYDKKVRGRVVVINCKACGQPVKVDGTIPPPAPEPTPITNVDRDAPDETAIPRSARVPREVGPGSRRFRKAQGEELPSLAEDWVEFERRPQPERATESAHEAVRISYADGAITVRQPIAKIGRYALFEQFASGGMATVHFGRLDGAGGFSRVVAIKRLLPHLVLDREFTEMLLKEARLAARVRHPNVVQTLDVVASKGDVLLVLEYVHGESLSTLCRIQAKEQKAFIPIPIVVAIMHGVLQGLHAVHEAVDEKGRALGLIHRDISPPNVIVGVDGMARVLDFGIAKALEHLEESVPNRLKGKTGYMSPEQIRGERLTRRSDVFAAGIILWEMLTLRRLFSAKAETDRIDRIMAGGYQSPREYREEIGKELEAVVMRALSFDTNERFATIREFEEALERTVPAASPRVVAEWVQELAHEPLSARARMVAQVENWDSGLPEGELTSSPFAADAALGGFGAGLVSQSTAPPPVTTTAPPPSVAPTAAPPSVASSTPPYSRPRLAPEPKRRSGLFVVAVLVVIVYVVRR